MPDYFSRNRILVGKLLLCFYMLGAVQAPFLELLHFISHSIVDHEHSGIHSYADHMNDPAHTLISVVDNGGEDDNEHQHSIENPFTKVEYLNQMTFAVKIPNERYSIPKDYAQLTGIKPEIPTPPPKNIG